MYTKSLSKIFTAVLLAVLILSACSPATVSPTAAPQPTKPPAPTETKVPATVAPPTATPVPPTATATPVPSGKLLVWVQKINMEAWQATVLPAFQKMYPDVKIEFVNYPPNDVATQAGLAIQGGAGGPDMFVTGMPWGTKLVNLGGLMDLTNLVKPYAADLDPAMLAGCTKDGKVYCLPWDSGPVGTFYRRDIFEAAGYKSDPDSVSALFATWDDMLGVCKTIKEKTKANCFSLNKANNDGTFYQYLLSSQGLGYFNAKGALTISSPENVATLNKMKIFWDANVVSDTQAWTDPWYSELKNPIGDAKIPPVATITIPVWMGGFLKGWVAPDLKGKWGVAQMPAFAANGSRNANSAGSSYFIPAASKNPQAAWALIKFLNLDPANSAAIYGQADIFPAYFPVYKENIFKQADDYFGGQQTRAFFATVAQKSPTNFFLHPYSQAMSDNVVKAIQSFATGKATAEDALKLAQVRVSLDTGLK